MLNKIAQHHHLFVAQKVWQARADSPAPERVHQRVRIWNEDAPLPKVGDIALIGFASDCGVRRNGGRGGAQDGPQALRKALAPMCVQNPGSPIVDFGDIVCPDENLEEAQNALAMMRQYACAQGARSLVFGGGHETAWGHYQGFAAHLGGRFAIVNFDAHFDLRPLVEGRGNSGTPFAQIAADRQQRGRGFDYTCIGIQPAANTATLFERARELGVRHILADAIHREGLATTFDLVERITEHTDQIYLSICLDVFAAAFAPGVSAPQAMGLTPSQVLPLLEPLLQSGKVIAIDLVELSPVLDPTGITARLAASIAAEVIEQWKVV